MEALGVAQECATIDSTALLSMAQLIFLIVFTFELCLYGVSYRLHCCVWLGVGGGNEEALGNGRTEVRSGVSSLMPIRSV